MITLQFQKFWQQKLMARSSFSQLSSTISTLDEQVRNFHKLGYGVITDFLTPQECSEIFQETQKLVQAQSSIFLRRNSPHYHSDTFKTHINFSQPPNDSALRLLFGRKAAHSLQELELFHQDFIKRKSIAFLLQKLEFNKPMLTECTYFYKNPQQEEDPLSQTTTNNKQIGATFWFALEDTSLNNGCLWGIPGSHRRKNAVNSTNGNRTEEFRVNEAIPLQMKKGSLIFFDGNFVRFSQKDQSSERSRHSFELNFAESGSAKSKNSRLVEENLIVLNDYNTTLQQFLKL